MEGDARMVSVIVDHWVDGDCDTELMAEARITRDGTMAWIKRADPGQPIGQFSDELMDALARPATSPGFDGSNAVVAGGEFPSLHLDLGETVLRMWEMTPSVDEDGQLVCRQAWVCSDENWIPIVPHGIMGKVCWSGDLGDRILFTPWHNTRECLRFAMDFEKYRDIPRFLSSL